MTLPEISQLVQADGFIPVTKKMVTKAGEKVIGICFHVPLILKNTWLDFYKLWLSDDYKVSYDSNEETLNIDL